MSAHDVATLRQFQGDGESRLVFARASSGAVVWMPPGEAESFRADARSGELSCIVIDCENPRLKAVNRDEKRHGFAHHAGAGGHSGMGIHHLQAQLLVARWLREKYPDAKVELEETTEDNRRRADVMFTSVSGRRAAFEIQYAGITPRAWKERHDAYQALGIVDIWLWGHTRPHLRRQRGSEEMIELNPTHEALADTGFPLMWINPEIGQIGLAITRHHSRHAGQFEALSTRGVGRFESHDFDLHRLAAEHGLTSDRLREIRVGLTAARALISNGERQEADAAALEVKRAANTQAFMERVVAKAEQRRREWVSGPTYKQILDDFGGHWPTFLKLAPVGSGDLYGRRFLLPFTDEHWQGRLYMQFLRKQTAGAPVTIKQCAAALDQWDPDVRYASEAVTSWFRQMARSGVLRKESFSYSGGRAGVRYVIQNLPELRTTALAERRRRQAFQAQDLVMRDHANAEFDKRQATLDEFFREAPVLMSVAELRALGLAIPHSPNRGGADRCAHCGGAIRDAPSVPLGYHTRCAPILSMLLRHPLVK